MSSRDCSFIITVRQPFAVDGFTHASNVMPVVRSKLAESFTVTQLLAPLKDKALPKRPDVLHVAPVIVPVLLLPDRSVTAVPLPSLNAYAATRTRGGGR